MIRLQPRRGFPVARTSLSSAFSLVRDQELSISRKLIFAEAWMKSLARGSGNDVMVQGSKS